MSKFHYTEKFLSIQGEGRHMGVPSVFLRMFGCNFRCKNFNRYEQDILGIETTHNPEVVEIIKNLDLYQTFDDLPLARTGCDSYSSVYPEFKRFVVKETAGELAQSLIDLLPFKEWREEHLVITGGEPLLGWQRSFPDLLANEKMWRLKELTFETNGTQEITNDFLFFLKSWTGSRGKDALTFSVSPKLSVSGEKWEEAFRPEIIAQYQQLGYTYLKFVVASKEDAEEAEQAYNEYKRYGFRGPVYLMGVGGTEDVFFKTNRQVADLALKKGWRYSDRMQVSLYGNAWGT